MLRPPVTIPITFVQGMLSGAHAQGQPCEPLLLEAGIPPQLLTQPGARVTAAQYATLFKRLIEHLDDECLGLLTRPMKKGSLALVTTSAISAATLEVAVRRAARTIRLLQDDVAVQVVHDEGAQVGLALRFANPETARPTFLHELLLRVLWRLFAWLVGGHLPITRIDFAFEQPAYAASYGKIFPAPLRFGCPESTLWFEAALMQAPVRRDAAAMRSFLTDAHAQIIVPRSAEDSVGTRVRAQLLRTQPAWPDLADMARALHMAPTTLQRRLASEGIAYQALKDELRRDTAIWRLNTSSVSLAELAAELGFNDGSAFQRAFKNWTGSPPGAYRR